MSTLLLFPIGHSTKVGRIVCGILNILLRVAAVLSVAFIVHLFIRGDTEAILYNVLVNGHPYPFVYIALMLASEILHRLGHFIAARAYDQQVYSIGMDLLGFIPAGLSFSMLIDEGLKKRKKIQIRLAGLEVELVITAIAFACSMRENGLAATWVYIAIFKALTVAANLLPYAGSDGEQTLSVLCGVESIAETAKKAVDDPYHRWRMIHSGPYGVVCFVFFAFVTLFGTLGWFVPAAHVAWAAIVAVAH